MKLLLITLLSQLSSYIWKKNIYNNPALFAITNILSLSSPPVCVLNTSRPSSIALSKSLSPPPTCPSNNQLHPQVQVHYLSHYHHHHFALVHQGPLARTTFIIGYQIYILTTIITLLCASNNIVSVLRTLSMPPICPSNNPTSSASPSTLSSQYHHHQLALHLTNHTSYKV